MSVLCPRAAATSRASTRSGAQPACARWVLVSVTTRCSGPSRSDGAGGRVVDRWDGGDGGVGRADGGGVVDDGAGRADDGAGAGAAGPAPGGAGRACGTVGAVGAAAGEASASSRAPRSRAGP